LFTLLCLLNCCERRGNVCFHCCDALPVAGQVAGCGVAPTGTYIFGTFEDHVDI
jgi:hypothetical protein